MLMLLGTWLSVSAQQAPFMTNGLIAYYPFSGNTKDASGNGNDGIGSNLAPAADRFGNPGSSYRFTVSEIYVPYKSAFNSSQITVSAWINTETGFGSQIIAARMQYGYSNPHGQVWLWGIDNDNLKHAVSIEDAIGGNLGGEHFPSLFGGVLQTNKWIFVGFTYDGKEFRIFKNGELEGSRALSLNLNTNGNSGISIGLTDQANGKFSYFKGMIDDMRIYTRALSTSEIAALYQYERSVQAAEPRQANATATVVNGFVVGSIIIDGGSGYTQAPKVVISGGGGSGATAIATIDSNGRVNGISIVTSGSRYTGIPNVAIDPPPFPPSQAKGTATLINGFVTGVDIISTGHGYEGVIPPVSFLGGGGSGAKGTAIVSNGMVTGISMTASGSGYTNAPYVLVAAPPGLASAAIEVSQVRLTLSLIPGYTYKIQTATDIGNGWVDVERDILAIEKTLLRTFDVTSSTQLFRVVQMN
jgi:hypothetical protein